MRNLFILFTVLLHSECAYGMDEDRNPHVMKAARHIVRPLVTNTLQKYDKDKSTTSNELDIFLRWTIGSKEFVSDLNSHIILYLREDKDPKYVGCPYSFKGVKEALAEEGIVLSEDRKSLTQHIQRGKIETDRLLPSTPLIRGDQISHTQPCCCFL